MASLNSPAEYSSSGTFTDTNLDTLVKSISPSSENLCFERFEKSYLSTLLESSPAENANVGISRSSTLEALMKTVKNLSSGPWRSMLTQAYLVALPTSRGLWTHAAAVMPGEANPLQQEMLGELSLLSTLRHPLALLYPRDSAYNLATLLRLRDIFSSRGWNSSLFDEDILCYEDEVRRKQPELAYKSYVFDAAALSNNEDLSSVCYSVLSKLNLLGNFSNSDVKQLYHRTITRKNNDEWGPGDSNSNNSSIFQLKNGSQSESISSHILEISANVENLDNNEPERVSGQSSSLDEDKCGVEPGPGGGHVTLLEAVDGITRGTTGLTSWGGGAVMAEWLDNNRQLLNGRRILELGAGVGYLAAAVLRFATAGQQTLHQRGTSRTPQEPHSTQHCHSHLSTFKNTAINAANHYSSVETKTLVCIQAEEAPVSDPVYTGPAAYTATDCHPHVLELLYHNLALMENNDKSYASLDCHRRALCEKLAREELPAGDVAARPWCPTSPVSVRGVPVQVQHLDWREPQLSVVAAAELIIAADIVYSRPLLQPLAQLIRLLLLRAAKNDSQSNITTAPTGGCSEPGSASSGAAYVACTRRSNETISHFLSLLSEQNLIYSLVYQATLGTEAALFVYNESHIPVKIYKITLQEDK